MKLVEGTVTIHPSQTWPDKHAVHLSHGQSCVVCHLHPRPTGLAEEGSGCAATTTHTTRSLVSSINLKPRKIRSNPAGKKDSLACLSERSTKKSERRSNDAKTNHKKHTADTTQDKTTTQKAPTDPSVAFLSLSLSPSIFPNNTTMSFTDESLPMSTADLTQLVRIRMQDDGLASAAPKTVMEVFDTTVKKFPDKPALHQKVVKKVCSNGRCCSDPYGTNTTSWG